MFCFDGANHSYNGHSSKTEGTFNVFHSNLDFRLTDKTALWIKGSGGSGKTTFLNIVSGQLVPSIGVVMRPTSCSYLNVNDGARGLIATATLKEAAFNNLFLRSSTVVTPDTVDKVLDFAELTRSANKLVQELSGSEKGRLVGTLSTFCLADVLIAEKIPSHSNREFQTKLYNAFEKQVENCKFLFLASPNPKIASRICDSVCDLDRKNITINKI